MKAGDTRVADLVDTVHHEIASTFCNHRVYKPVVASNVFIGEPVGQSTRYICSMWQ